MDLGGLCSICSKASRTLNTCWKCGAIVCNEHYDRSTGLCVNCSPKKKPGVDKWKK